MLTVGGVGAEQPELGRATPAVAAAIPTTHDLRSRSGHQRRRLHPRADRRLERPRRAHRRAALGCLPLRHRRPAGAGSTAASKPPPSRSRKARSRYGPFASLPLRGFFNYGRGISSLDARGVIRRPESAAPQYDGFLAVGRTTAHRRTLFDAGGLLSDPELEPVGLYPRRRHDRVLRPEPLVRLRDQDRPLRSLTSCRSTAASRRFSTPTIRDTEPRHVCLRRAAFRHQRRGHSERLAGLERSLRMRAINRYRLDDQDPSIAPPATPSSTSR